MAAEVFDEKYADQEYRRFLKEKAKYTDFDELRKLIRPHRFSHKNLELAFKKDCLHLAPPEVFPINLHLPSSRLQRQRGQMAKEPGRLFLCKIVCNHPAPAPESAWLHLLASARPHVLCPELPEEEPPTRAKHPPHLAGDQLSPRLEDVPCHVEGEDRIEALAFEGQMASIGQEKRYPCTLSRAAQPQRLWGDVDGCYIPAPALHSRQSLAVAAAQLQHS
jgi:hypothetical protein